MIDLNAISFSEESSHLLEESKNASSCSSRNCTCVVFGGENVGKTQLLASLTGKLPLPENFRGSTITCEAYRDGEINWTDTPGILRESETSASQSAINELGKSDRVMLVARADRAAEELPVLLPVIAGSSGFVTLTFNDRLESRNRVQIEKLSTTLGVPVFLINARELKRDEAAAIRSTVLTPSEELGLSLFFN